MLIIKLNNNARIVAKRIFSLKFISTFISCNRCACGDHEDGKEFESRYNQGERRSLLRVPGESKSEAV